MPPPPGSAAVKAACIYCRLSYAPDGSVEKVERQEADARAIAERLGWPVCCVHSDNSKSAWQRNRKRPAWDSMLETLEPAASHHHDAIIVYHGDRLIRQPWDLELLLRLADDRHVPLASVSGVRDLNNEDDRYILRIEAAGFCRASADASRRIKRGWEARAKKGTAVGGGKRPFGFGVPIPGRTGRTGKQLYDTTVQVPEEAAVLAEATARLLAGQSMGGVVSWMNTVSTTSEGGKWASRGLKLLLQAPRIAGLIDYGGTLHEAVWDPIISVEDWEAVKQLLDQKASEHTYYGRERRHLLSGIATCVTCGTKVRTKPVGGRNRPTTRLYHCWNLQCPKRVSRNQVHLDRYVEGQVLRRLQDPDLMDQVLSPEPSVAAEIVTLERRRADAKAKFKLLADHPDLDAADLAESLAGFSRKITQLRERQAATSRQRLLARMAGISEEGWRATPIDVRADTVRALYRVVILPATWRGPGFDPACVRLDPVAL